MGLVTGPMEFEIEAEPIDASHLVYVRCSECGAPKVPCAPDQMRVALCGACRTQVAASAATILRLPDVPPPPMVWSGSEKILAQDGAERAEVVPPELVCPMGGCGHDVPGPVAELTGAALKAGWTVSGAHSRGGVMGGAGQQLAVADIWSVRFRRGEWAGYAVRRGEAWDSVCITGATLPPFLALGVTDLRQWLADPDRSGSWYDAIRERVAAQAVASKNVKCPGPGVCTLDLVALAFVPFGVPVVQIDHTHRANGDIKIKITRKQAQHGQ